MDRIAELNHIVEEHDLNKHPFYQEWVAGTLPVAKLKAYASEYGHFIATIADGWDAVGRPELADEERWHERLWAQFRASVAASDSLDNPETAELVLDARNAFKSKDSAIGGLYAFEAQQPHTSASKLRGLDTHYDISATGKRYFQVHADDTSEAEILAAMLDDLTDVQFETAKKNCQRVCKAMWTALDGVYSAELASA